MSHNVINLPTPSLYRPYTLDAPRNKTKFISFRYPNGQKEHLIAKDVITQVFTSSHQNISFIYNGGTITLKGRDLRGIIEYFIDDRIRSINAFNPVGHLKPQEGEPIIEDIQHQNTFSALIQ